MVSGTVDSTELLDDIFEEECLSDATTKRNRRIQIFGKSVVRKKQPAVIEAPKTLSGKVVNINIARARSMTQWFEPTVKLHQRVVNRDPQYKFNHGSVDHTQSNRKELDEKNRFSTDRGRRCGRAC
jgi:hypothetical protein